jgi:hypothetical protein
MKARHIAKGLIAAVCAGTCLALPPQGTNAAMKHGSPLNSAQAEAAQANILSPSEPARIVTRLAASSANRI